MRKLVRSLGTLFRDDNPLAGNNVLP
jgi:hypothetical protein